MPQKIAPSAVKAQELAALLQGQTDVSRPGDSPPSGSAGGPAATWTMVERGPHLAYRKSEGWQLSTSSGARRRSIPTFHSQKERQKVHWHFSASAGSLLDGGDNADHHDYPL
jgi:hypothetical protein